MRLVHRWLCGLLDVAHSMLLVASQYSALQYGNSVLQAQ